MKRMTFEGNFCDIAQCADIPCQCAGNCTQKQVWERLKAYEDSGLSPEQCRAWAEDMKPKFLKMRDYRDFWKRVYESGGSVRAFIARAGISNQVMREATEDHRFRRPVAKRIAEAMGAELDEIFVECR